MAPAHGVKYPSLQQQPSRPPQPENDEGEANVAYKQN